MEASQFVTQAVGFAGCAAFIVSYQIRSNRILFLLQLIGSALFSLQFLLLRAYSGCLSLVVYIVRDAVLMKYSDWVWVRWKGWPWAICAVLALITAATWAGPISLLAFTASAVNTVGCWTNNAGTIRKVNLFCSSPCWLAYDCITGSWGGVLEEGISMVSILVSVARFGWKALGNPESEFQK